jgi:hypothetical protein
MMLILDNLLLTDIFKFFPHGDAPLGLSGKGPLEQLIIIRGYRMASGYNFKTASEVNSIANKFRTSIDAEYLAHLAANYSTTSSATSYNVPDGMTTRLADATAFILNSSIKDSTTIDEAETQLSYIFGKFLTKYFETGLTTDDILSLMNYVTAYNSEDKQYYSTHYPQAVFGVSNDEGSSFFKDAIVKYIDLYFSSIVLAVSDGKTNLSFSYSTVPSSDFTAYSDETSAGSATYGVSSSAQTFTGNSLSARFLKDPTSTYKSSLALKGIIKYIASLAMYSAIKEYLSSVGMESPVTVEITTSNTVGDSVDYQTETINNVIYDIYVKNASGDYIKKDFSSYNKIQTATYYVLNSVTNGSSYKEKLFSVSWTIASYSVNHSKSSYSGKDAVNTVKGYLMNQSTGLFETIAGIDEVCYDIPNYTVLSTDSKVFLSSIGSGSDDLSKSILLMPSEPVYASSTDYHMTVDMFPTYSGKSYKEKGEIVEYFIRTLAKSKIQYMFFANGSEAYKNSATLDEFIDMNDGKLIAMMSFKKIALSQTQYSALVSMLSNNGESAETSAYKNIDGNYLINLSVMYKELNPVYREIEYSDLIEYAATGIDSAHLFDDSTRYDSIISYTNKLILSDNAVACLGALRVHPYYCRRAKESDIIQYMTGSYIGYGVNSSEKNEITKFLDMYRQTRDFYYRNILNKSFILDDNYKAYEHIFILDYALIRFLSYKQDELHNINYYDDTDIDNFLDSYGLNALKDSAAFYNQFEYKKRMVANYNSLVRSKGSRQVMSMLQSIFSDSVYSVTVNRYVLVSLNGVSDGTDGNKEFYENSSKEVMQDNSLSQYPRLVFVRIPYDAVNEHEAVMSAISNNDFSEYSDFVKDDSTYWKIGQDLISKEISGAVSTKYSGYELSESIAKVYAMTRYCISAMSIIEKYGSKHYLTSTSDQRGAVSLDYVDTDVKSSSDNVDLYQYYRAIWDAFEYYLYKKQEESLKLLDDKHFNPFMTMTNRYGIASAWPSGNDKDLAIINNLISIYDTAASNVSAKNIQDYGTLYSNVYNLRKASLLKFCETIGNTGVDGLTSIDQIMDYADGLCIIYHMISSKWSNDGIVNFLKYMCAKNSDTASFSSVLANAGTGMPFSILYKYIISPMIKLPIDYYGNGLLNGSMSDSLLRNNEFEDLIEYVINNVYTDASMSYGSKLETSSTYGYRGSSLKSIDVTGISTIDSSFQKVTDSLSSSSLISVFFGSGYASMTADAISDKITEMISDATEKAENLDDMSILYSTSSNSNNAAAFINAALTMFISYTSQIYDVKLYKTYDTKSECMPVTDSVTHAKRSVRTDVMYSDESVTIKKVA